MKSKPPIKFLLWSRPKNRIKRSLKLCLRRLWWMWCDFGYSDLRWLNLFAIIASVVMGFYCAAMFCKNPTWWMAWLIYVNADTFARATMTEDKYKCATTASDTKE